MYREQILEESLGRQLLQFTVLTICTYTVLLLTICTKVLTVQSGLRFY